MGYKEVEIKAKCIRDYSEFKRGKLYKLVKSDSFGARVYINKHDYVNFDYGDYTFYFIDVATHRNNIIEDILGY